MYCSCFSCFVLFCFVLFFLPLNVTKVRDFVSRKNFYISFADAEFDLIALLLDGQDICDKAQTRFLHSNSSLLLIG